MHRQERSPHECNLPTNHKTTRQELLRQLRRFLAERQFRNTITLYHFRFNLVIPRSLLRGR